MSDKMTRKELKAPDAFQKAGAEATSWFEERRKAITIAVAVVIVAGLGVALANQFSVRGEERASKELGDALRPLTRDVDANAKPAEGADADEIPFKTQNEKDQAVEKSLTDFRSAHSGTKAAVTATLPLAQAEFRLGKFDDALKDYDDYLKKANPEDPVRAEALEGKGYAYEAKKDYDQALAAFEQLARENKTDFLAGMGAFHRARILIEQGKKEEAAKELAQIPVQFKDTAAARMAQERLSQLVAQGITPPPPMPGVSPDAG